MPLSVRSGLYPIFGDKIYGPIGDIADLLAFFASVFGIATSLGLGAQQIGNGLELLFDIPGTLATPGGLRNQLILVVIIGTLAIVSVVTGLKKGIRFLSVLNLRLSIIMLLFFLLVGPTIYLLGSLVRNFGHYVQNFWLIGSYVEGPEGTWQGGWTIFYWGWWISWGPLVGIFIARISKGRTIREFVAGVMITPTILSIIWITLFANTGIFIELFGPGGIIEPLNRDGTSSALYTTLRIMSYMRFPAAGEFFYYLGAIICMVMLVTYFVTSCDSVILVLVTQLSMGNHNVHKSVKIFCGAGITASAAGLLLAGGLETLQTASIITAFPYSFVIMLTVIGFCKAIQQDDVPLYALKKKKKAALA